MNTEQIQSLEVLLLAMLPVALVDLGSDAPLMIRAAPLRAVQGT